MFGAWSAGKALVVAALVASPAGLGIAAVTGSLDGAGALGSLLPFLAAGAEDPPEPGAFGGVVVQEFTREFDGSVATGALDLRIDRGAIAVFGWEEDAYLVQVLQEKPSGQSVSDHETVVEFQDQSSDDHAAFTIVVDQRGTYAAGVQGDATPRTAIVAWVPMGAAYETVHLCTGQSVAGIGLPDLPDPLPGRDPAPEACVQSDAASLVDIGGRIMDDGSGDDLEVPFGVFGLQGGTLTIATDNAAVALEAVAFDRIEASTDNGSVTGTEVEAGELVVATDNGAVVFEGLRAEAADITTDNGQVEVREGVLGDATIATDNGGIMLDLVDALGGALDLTTDNGAVAVRVPQGESYGYDVTASTDNGRIVIVLADAEVKGGEEDDASGQAGKGGMPSRSATARTNGFDERPVQVTLTVETDNGGIKVTDGSGSDEAQPDDPDSASPAAPVADRLAGKLLR